MSSRDDWKLMGRCAQVIYKHYTILYEDVDHLGISVAQGNFRINSTQILRDDSTKQKMGGGGVGVERWLSS